MSATDAHAAKAGPQAIRRVVTAAALLVDTVTVQGEPAWISAEQRDAFHLLEQQLRDVQAIVQEGR